MYVGPQVLLVRKAEDNGIKSQYWTIVALESEEMWNILGSLKPLFNIILIPDLFLFLLNCMVLQ